MALNPYTLYRLYEKGILDYVPMDLMQSMPMSSMAPMSNPYLNMAQQGDLYQNHGVQSDSFHFSGVQSPYAQQQISSPVYPVQIGSLSNAGGMNMFNGNGVGTNSVSTIPGIFGFKGVTGSLSNAGGMNMFNGNGIGMQTQTGGLNAFGGFADTQNSLVNGFNKAASIVDRTPKLILGLIAGAIGIAGIKMAFKRGGKSSVSKTGSFLSKLNPKNWSWFSKKS